jgi:hypothetical protein
MSVVGRLLTFAAVRTGTGSQPPLNVSKRPKGDITAAHNASTRSENDRSPQRSIARCLLFALCFSRASHFSFQKAGRDSGRRPSSPPEPAAAHAAPSASSHPAWGESIERGAADALTGSAKRMTGYANLLR